MVKRRKPRAYNFNTVRRLTFKQHICRLRDRIMYIIGNVLLVN